MRMRIKSEEAHCDICGKQQGRVVTAEQVVCCGRVRVMIGERPTERLLRS